MTAFKVSPLARTLPSYTATHCLGYRSMRRGSAAERRRRAGRGREGVPGGALRRCRGALGGDLGFSHWLLTMRHREQSYARTAVSLEPMVRSVGKSTEVERFV